LFPKYVPLISGFFCLDIAIIQPLVLAQTQLPQLVVVFVAAAEVK